MSRAGAAGMAMLAQAYNHMIMPLASRHNKETQVGWGIVDFRHRFGREPEGMWLAETAVDIESLEVLAEDGVAFTIWRRRQAKRWRRRGARSGGVPGGVDPSRHTCAGSRRGDRSPCSFSMPRFAPGRLRAAAR